MNKNIRRIIKGQVTMAIEGSQMDVHDLVDLLEISVEDLIKAYGHRLVDHAEKFGVDAHFIQQEVEEREGRKEAVDENERG